MPTLQEIRKLSDDLKKAKRAMTDIAEAESQIAYLRTMNSAPRYMEGGDSSKYSAENNAIFDGPNGLAEMARKRELVKSEKDIAQLSDVIGKLDNWIENNGSEKDFQEVFKDVTSVQSMMVGKLGRPQKSNMETIANKITSTTTRLNQMRRDFDKPITQEKPDAVKGSRLTSMNDKDLQTSFDNSTIKRIYNENVLANTLQQIEIFNTVLMATPVEAKQEEPKPEVKAEKQGEPKPEVKAEIPKEQPKEEAKQEEPKPEVKEEKKEDPKPEVKEEPKKEEPKPEVKEEKKEEPQQVAEEEGPKLDENGIPIAPDLPDNLIINSDEMSVVNNEIDPEVAKKSLQNLIDTHKKLLRTTTATNKIIDEGAEMTKTVAKHQGKGLENLENDLANVENYLKTGEMSDNLWESIGKVQNGIKSAMKEAMETPGEPTYADVNGRGKKLLTTQDQYNSLIEQTRKTSWNLSKAIMAESNKPSPDINKIKTLQAQTVVQNRTFQAAQHNINFIKAKLATVGAGANVLKDDDVLKKVAEEVKAKTAFQREFKEKFEKNSKISEAKLNELNQKTELSEAVKEEFIKDQQEKYLKAREDELKAKVEKFGKPGAEKLKELDKKTGLSDVAKAEYRKESQEREAERQRKETQERVANENRIKSTMKELDRLSKDLAKTVHMFQSNTQGFVSLREGLDKMLKQGENISKENFEAGMKDLMSSINKYQKDHSNQKSFSDNQLSRLKTMSRIERLDNLYQNKMSVDSVQSRMLMLAEKVTSAVISNKGMGVVSQNDAIAALTDRKKFLEVTQKIANSDTFKQATNGKTSEELLSSMKVNGAKFTKAFVAKGKNDPTLVMPKPQKTVEKGANSPVLPQ